MNRVSVFAVSLLACFLSIATLHATTIDVSAYATGGTGTAANPWTSTDGTAGIQAALSALTALAPHDGVLYAPAGYYLITTRIDFTQKSTGSIGQFVGDGSLTFRGDGPLETSLIGATGGMVIDTTGRGHLTLENFGIIHCGNCEAAPSTLGIFQARGQLAGGGNAPFPQHQDFKHVYIDLPSDSTANGGHGTIGIYNRGAESGIYDNLQVNADIGLVLTADNVYSISTSVTGLTHPTTAFCTNNHIRGGNLTTIANYSTSSWSNVIYAVPLVLQGATDNTTVDGTILRKSTAAPAAGNTTAIRVYPNFTDLSTPIRDLRIHSIQVENLAGFLATSAPLEGAELSGSIGQDTTVALISLDSSVSGLKGSRVDITPASNSTLALLVYDNASTTAGVTNCTLLLPPTLHVVLPSSPNVGNRLLTEKGTSLDGLLLPVKEVTLSTGANSNVAVGASSFLRISGPAGAFSIGGFADGVDGKVLYVYNGSGQPLTIKHADTASSAGNRISTATLGNVVLSGNGSATFIYYTGTGTGVWVLVTPQS